MKARMGATHFITKTLPKVEAEMAPYGVALQEVLRRYGAKFLVCGGTFEAVEGKVRGRNIVLEFKDYATALACYQSPEYARRRHCARAP
ncbi:hypothetical protein A1D31_39170 [Bradyrhizobium liaoningense]|nr:hypothetical protein A1D31_39170 [Bradyrhizobium liaoningense]